MEANDVMDRILPEFIAGDLRKSLEHPYLFTACQYYTSRRDQRDAYLKRNEDWKNLSDDEILEKYGDKGAPYGYPHFDLGYSQHDDTSHWPCTVLTKEDKEGMYTVRIHQNPWEDVLPWDENRVPRILTEYHRSNIHYFVRTAPTHIDDFIVLWGKLLPTVVMCCALGAAIPKRPASAGNVSTSFGYSGLYVP